MNSNLDMAERNLREAYRRLQQAKRRNRMLGIGLLVLGLLIMIRSGATLALHADDSRVLAMYSITGLMGFLVFSWVSLVMIRDYLRHR